MKSIYSVTRCVLKGFGKLSEVFQTHTGIKQGASSSVILFIIFLDDIIDTLKLKCINEPILSNLHCLLHADDTLALSTNRSQFIHKCNVLIDAFCEKKMILNFKKSGYMIINGGNQELKCCIEVKSGWLQYNSTQKYLGVLFSDTGILKHDVSLFLEKKTKEVNVKFASFLRKNEDAPVSVKLKVVDACINSALTYGCEAWGSCPLNSIEILQRKALKMVLGISRNTSNEILYIESDFRPLKPLIYKRQLKYFRKLKENCNNNPTSSISKIFVQALNSNTTYLRHYTKLDRSFETPEVCFKFHAENFETQMRQKIQDKYDHDANSILGTYFRVNQTLTSPTFYSHISCNEVDRITITKYRVGCHTLKIQSGRLSGVSKREDRLCDCKNDIQTLEHVLMYCPITENVRYIHNLEVGDLWSFFNGKNLIKIASCLKAIENIMS